MQYIELSRTVSIPDYLKLERYRTAPHSGPRILFFSGGTALQGVARDIIKYTHNSVHLITPFDSGGSSATLRDEFSMPAVGDIRNRLMSLTDDSIHGNPEIFAFFAYRLNRDASQKELREELSHICEGTHPLIKAIPQPMRTFIQASMLSIQGHISGSFDLRGASLGNLVLAAEYLNHDRRLSPVIYLYSKLAEVRGLVRPIANATAQIAVSLIDGRTIVGQHRITGKECEPVTTKIDQIWLAKSLHDASPVSISISNQARTLINEAELICYPMGSFYSSVIANLLPKGVGATIAQTKCPKVFIPNTGTDAELVGHTLSEQVDTLLFHLKKDSPNTITTNDVLNLIVVDSDSTQYNGSLNNDMLSREGIRVVSCDLITKQSSPYIDAAVLNRILLSLC
ncbi:GAK system CofD-like protein [Halodesulfovibrio marinisediminis]|uniref:CofD-related protein, GAK system n=1 Tax=Halodesulfovibrio marinisediminis DSM 17456 TaxID=1121457 RepID=A0A1N6H0Q8_9BACT|nr:GAK system CofD-like protein [Halodesulfovibrio marinisediminis]SIO13292.1 CofD-related protein, GAK system [Halodesulfovibrio marinisediminis DSM 17456]